MPKFSLSSRISSLALAGFAGLCLFLALLPTAASADTSELTITSMAQDGSPLASGLVGTETYFYTNDPTASSDTFTVTVHGDPAATEIELLVGNKWVGPATPDSNGNATFTVSGLPSMSRMTGSCAMPKPLKSMPVGSTTGAGVTNVPNEGGTSTLTS